MRLSRSRPAVRRQIALVTAAEAAPTRRRRHRWLIAAAVVLGAVGIAQTCWIRGDGLILDGATAVSPIAQARISKVMVRCLDRVSAGQPMAELENEVTIQAARQQLNGLETQLAQATSDIEVSTKGGEAASKLYDGQVAVRNQVEAIFKAQDSLLRNEHVAALVWTKAKADVERAEAEVLAANYVYETKREAVKKATIEAELLRQRIDALRASPELTGRFVLVAPKDGIVTQCEARAGEVVEAKKSLFQVFNVRDASAVAFLDPSDAVRLEPGRRIRISVRGVDGAFEGEVVGHHPEITGLPDALTRYFWQEEKWSQYMPVRISLAAAPAAKAVAIKDGAQVSISAWEPPADLVGPWDALKIAVEFGTDWLRSVARPKQGELSTASGEPPRVAP
jgi:multidrug resistance efflux pump